MNKLLGKKEEHLGEEIDEKRKVSAKIKQMDGILNEKKYCMVDKIELRNKFMSSNSNEDLFNLAKQFNKSLSESQ